MNCKIYHGLLTSKSPHSLLQDSLARLCSNRIKTFCTNSNYSTTMMELSNGLYHENLIAMSKTADISSLTLHVWRCHINGLLSSTFIIKRDSQLVTIFVVTFCINCICSFVSEAVYSWLSVNVPLTCPVCLSSLGQESLQCRCSVCAIYLGILKDDQNGGWLADTLFSVIPSKITFFHYIHSISSLHV